MHILQPKHTKLSNAEIDALLKKLNISISQLPKLKKNDAALPEDCVPGDVVKIERKDKDSDKKTVYYRVVVA